MRKGSFTNQDLIGERLENFFLNKYKGFKRINSKGILPDFYNPKYGFWVEAKNGNIEWGIRIKKRQIEGFPKLDEPVIYYIGYHNLNEVNLWLKNRSIQGKRNFLTRNMDILETHFFTSSLMERIWEKEWRLSDNKKTIYCSFKKHILNRVFYNKSFEDRVSGERVVSEDYYGYNPKKILILPKESLPQNGFFDSIVLDLKKDGVVLDYIKDLVYERI